MLPFYPSRLAKKSVTTYLLTLVFISTLYFRYAMDFKFMVFGISEVCLFFYFSNKLSIRLGSISSHVFEKRVFMISLIIREAWVLFAYFFYISQNGVPFEWEYGDSMGYHDTAVWLSTDGWEAIKYWFFTRGVGVSDMGYEIWLTILYLIFGPNILIVRIIKGIISSYTVLLIYRLSSRTFGDKVGRIASVFSMLMPNLIYYCGLHLKETEMVFLAVAFLYRADVLLRTGRFSFKSILFTFLLCFALFCFRTALGAVALIALFLAILFVPNRVMVKRKKVQISVIVGVVMIGMAGGSIANEVKQIWSGRGTNQDKRRIEQITTNDWAKYATGAVMAPIIFVMPFSTMVDVGQYAQQMIHGGNFVKTLLGIYVLIALFNVLIRDKNWRVFSLLGAYTVGYLVVLAFSAFANAERFHMPALPCILMFAAYGVTQLNSTNMKYVNLWFYLVFVMEFAWTFFKLGGRGLL